jgi:hypothetical protein
MFTRDEEFEKALASPEALEKRLASLRKTRKIAYITAIFLMIAFFTLVFMGFSIIMKYPAGNATGVAINASMTLFLAFQQAAAALSAQADIRSLMVYKMMLKTSSPQGTQP